MNAKETFGSLPRVYYSTPVVMGFICEFIGAGKNPEAIVPSLNEHAR